ncbi:heavy metal-associated isoprenylated plant protein 3-like [Phragmites australis]|uniref:heavy metal-associated isoprenylated plant protein 3-like n=1 Tax=Phragmites australis TaxID=29695 RepID=UPI002D78FAEB|nr:heavy metal-associated isoprenylated plant protein 3-like [Phragmites australis]
MGKVSRASLTPICRDSHSSGGGGGGQQQKPAVEVSAAAEEGEEQDVAANTSACDDGQAEDKDKDKDKEKGKEKKVPPVVTAVLKVDMHCDGCAKRIRGSVRRYPGVEGVAMEVDKGTMTVVGRFDAKKLRDRVAKKTKKKVDLVGDKGGGGNKGGGGGNKKGDEENGKPDKEHEYDQEEKDKEKEKEEKGKDDKGGGNGGKGKGGKDNKKPVVPVVGTVVLKIGSFGLHCDGCMNRIRTKLFKIKGVEQVGMDMGKNQVTVTGTMDIKALPEKLRKKLRRPVDVVPNKDKDGKDKDKDGKQQQEGGKEKEKDAATKALTEELEAWKAAFYDQHALINTEFMLSDENPNACSLM